MLQEIEIYCFRVQRLFYAQGIFYHLFLEFYNIFVIFYLNGPCPARHSAFAAANAPFLYKYGLFLFYAYCVSRAHGHARAAANAFFNSYLRKRAGVLKELSLARSASHAEVLKRAGKT